MSSIRSEWPTLTWVRMWRIGLKRRNLLHFVSEHPEHDWSTTGAWMLQFGDIPVGRIDAVNTTQAL